MAQTFGQYLVNEQLPGDMQVTGPMTQKQLYAKIYTMSRRDPQDAATRIDGLRHLGHELATTEGMSIGLDDITPDPRVKKITSATMAHIKGMTDDGKRRTLIDKASEDILKLAPEHPGSMGETMRAGARGKAIQLTRTANSQMFSQDPVSGKPFPYFIPRGFAEGLRSGEHWLSSVEARENLTQSRVAVVEPGAASKVFINNMNNQMILSEDCGTSNGIMMNTEDANISDRYLARAEGGLPKNALITPQVATRLRSKLDKVMVRSPMTCELNDGICQKCYGLDEKGQPHTLGTNVGIRSAQAMTEPITQFVISARHAIRAGSEKDARNLVPGLRGVQQLVDIPKSFLNKATLSSINGKVESVDKAPQGGFNISVGENKFYVPPHLSPIVKSGDRVTPGDALSDGLPRPDEIVQYKGLGAGRRYLVDRMHDVFKDRGSDLDKRHFEVLARSHLNYVRIEHDPEKRFHPGEVVNYTTLMKSLAEDVDEVGVKDSVGHVLARGHLHHLAGTVVTPEIAKELAANKVHEVVVSRRPPEVSFFMRPLTRNPLLNPDWMARLGHRHLKESILEGVQTGQVSNIHGTHPAPAFAYGAEFGKGQGGRY